MNTHLTTALEAVRFIRAQKIEGRAKWRRHDAPDAGSTTPSSSLRRRARTVTSGSASTVGASPSSGSVSEAPKAVRIVVTLGTPHNGAAWYSNLCLWGQCTGLKPGSSELNWLNQNGNPQGKTGTEFTTIGSTEWN